MHTLTFHTSTSTTYKNNLTINLQWVNINSITNISNFYILKYCNYKQIINMEFIQIIQFLNGSSMEI
jgi:hypothetical protein